MLLMPDMQILNSRSTLIQCCGVAVQQIPLPRFYQESADSK